MRRFPNDTETSNIEYSYREFFRFLWEQLKPSRGRFFVATFFRATSDIVWLYPPYAISVIINTLGQPMAPSSTHTLTVAGIFWALAIAYRITGQYISKNLGFFAAARASIDAQLRTIRHLFQLDMAWHERENSGNKLKRIDRGGQAINQMTRFWFGMVIEIFVNFTGTLFIISRVTLGLGGSLLVFIIGFMVLSQILTKRAAQMENLVDQKEEDIQGLAFESINNIRTVKALALSETLLVRLNREFADMLVKIRERIRRYQTRGNLLGLWGNGFRMVSMLIIAFGVYHGHYTLGFLVLFLQYFNRLWESVSELSELAPDVISAKYAVARMENILHEPVRIDDEQGKHAFPTDWKTMTVDHLSFSYGQTEVLHDLNFTIKRGERIGIVGLSGAGKSTLFKLFMKEHEGYTGEITFDGVALRDVQKRSYLTSLAAVLQETEVFNFSLRDNIALANPEDQTADLTQALNIAHVADFLHKLPQGLDTLIGEKGFRLSGGEKQRVGIARAIYKKPQILLLDEATSHLDLESEKKIQDSLHQFFQTVTAIVIAHRLTTIKEMDRIIVIEGGRIVESGSFSELQDKRGRFYELWEQQRL